jgi:hypothetical protein
MLADSLYYLSSRYWIEGIHGVHSQRNLDRIVPKLLPLLVEFMHKNVRTSGGKCGDLMWQKLVCCERWRLLEYENGRLSTKNRATASGLHSPATPLAAFLRMETYLAVPKQRAMHGVRSSFAQTCINVRRTFDPLSAPPSPAVSRMSPDTCRTGMLSCPAAVHTSNFLVSVLSAVMLVIGAAGRSSKGVSRPVVPDLDAGCRRQRGRPDRSGQQGTRTCEHRQISGTITAQRTLANVQCP